VVAGEGPQNQILTPTPLDEPASAASILRLEPAGTKAPYERD